MARTSIKSHNSRSGRSRRTEKYVLNSQSLFTDTTHFNFQISLSHRITNLEFVSISENTRKRSNRNVKTWSQISMKGFKNNRKSNLRRWKNSRTRKKSRFDCTTCPLLSDVKSMPKKSNTRKFIRAKYPRPPSFRLSSRISYSLSPKKMSLVSQMLLLMTSFSKTLISREDLTRGRRMVGVVRNFKMCFRWNARRRSSGNPSGNETRVKFSNDGKWSAEV